MFLLLRFFNSVFFVIANVSITAYTLFRFFRAMRSHYQLVNEVEDFSCLVDQSRASLDFVGSKLMEAIKEMEADIGKEVYVTHNLTALSTNIATVTKRFQELEEAIIELARLNENVENATVGTPMDINEEVRRILRRKSAMMDSSQPPECPQIPKSPRKLSKNQRNNQVVIETIQSQPPPTIKYSSHLTKPSPRSRTPNLVPDVMLLDEQRANPLDKPIGFRPPWMCQV